MGARRNPIMVDLLGDVPKAVYLGVGSNIERERYIVACLEALSSRYGPLIHSSVYESEAYGFEGDPFYNLVVGFETRIPIAELAEQLKLIERKIAGVAIGRKYRARKLDIDILLYGQSIQSYGSGNVPREDIIKYEFVLRPLAEIAPWEKHPVINQPYTALLQERFATSTIKSIEICKCYKK